jgi:hypothetical protein
VELSLGRRERTSYVKGRATQKNTDTEEGCQHGEGEGEMALRGGTKLARVGVLESVSRKPGEIGREGGRDGGRERG